MKNILTKIEQANLIGRGGACFPTALKWSMVKKARGDKKYVLCNASEGEPGIKKDYHILTKHPGRVIDGMSIAIDFLKAEKGFIYINPSYYKRVGLKLKRLTRKHPITLFKKDHKAGYIGGEETSAINHIEGKRIEPRLRPPYPPTHGLWGHPTLVNNVETFYAVSLIAAGEYKNERFYTINGDCLETGIHSLPEHWTIEKILKETGNYPDFDFFVQVGGDGSGEVLNSSQLRRSASGGASITVYSMLKYDPFDLIKNWVNFFKVESCGQCTPCREGTYRLKEILNYHKPDWKLFSRLLDNLSDTSFCGLGCAVHIPIRSFVKNVLPKMPDKNIKLPKGDKKFICDCFK